MQIRTTPLKSIELSKPPLHFLPLYSTSKASFVHRISYFRFFFVLNSWYTILHHSRACHPGTIKMFEILFRLIQYLCEYIQELCGFLHSFGINTSMLNVSLRNVILVEDRNSHSCNTNTYMDKNRTQEHTIPCPKELELHIVMQCHYETLMVPFY